MAAISRSNRITSKDLHVEMTPVGTPGGANKIRLYFRSTDGAAVSGTFRLWVNGKITAAITYSGTAATLATSIASALNATPVLGAAAVTTADSVADPGNVEVTNAVADKYFRYQALNADDDGDSTINADIEILVLVQGTEAFRIDSHASAFSYEESVDLVDMTAISEFETLETSVKSSMSWEMSLYEAKQAFSYALFGGAEVVVSVWETGKVSGSKYFVFGAILDTAGKDFPDHEKVDYTISGVRVGKMIVPFDTRYLNG